MDDSLAIRYLSRIGLTYRPPTDLAGLTTLQTAHLVEVPFENLDVWAGNDVRCDEASALREVVGRRTGGWCFELNGAFAALLDHLRFDVTMLAATVLLAEPPSPLPDHLTLRVDLDRPYLVDVGFGAGTPRRPLPLDTGEVLDGGNAPYRFVGDVLERQRARDRVWEPCFRIEGTTSLADLASSSKHLAGTDNIFTRSPFATRALDGRDGRVTWNEEGLTIVEADHRRTTHDVDPVAVLDEWFGISDPPVRLSEPG